MRVAVWLACAACSFNPRAPITGDGDPGSEVTLPDEEAGPPEGLPSPQLCATAPLLDEEFDGTTPCPPWGSPFGTAPEQQSNGALRVEPAAAFTNGGCSELSLHDWSAVLVEVSSIVTGEDTFTGFQLLGLNRTVAAVNNDLLFATDNGSTIFRRIDFDPIAMRWWRMRADEQAGTVVAEYSADAMAWQLLHAQQTVIGDTRVNLIAGANGFTPAGVAAYERLVICP